MDAVVAASPVIGGHDDRRVLAARSHATEDREEVPQRGVGRAQ